jgi:hypothetical protein
LKEKALDRTMWTARFGRGFRPVVRQTAKWMNDSKVRTARTMRISVNPLNAELNFICHLLILLEDLMFMGPCIVSIF